MVTTKKYVKLAEQIYDLIEAQDPIFEDVVAALALVNLWITVNAIDYGNDNNWNGGTWQKNQRHMHTHSSVKLE